MQMVVQTVVQTDDSRADYSVGKMAVQWAVEMVVMTVEQMAA